MRIEENTTLVSPFHFLDIATKVGLYRELSNKIFAGAFSVLERSEAVLSLNFTYDDIIDREFLYDLQSRFKSDKTLGQRCIFEITESQAMENYDEVKKFVDRFRRYGVRFAIDDFGSGFSNFEYIIEIEPDYLKIDGSLVKNIDTDEKAHILVQAITRFSHELGIKVIAEYVHSKVIFDMLLQIGVDEFQGFYFSEPVRECYGD